MGDELLLGQLLVDGDHRGGEAAMGVGQAHQVEHPLNGAVLARRAVERVEHQVGLSFRKTQCNVAIHVDPRHPVSEALERIGDVLARDERHLALGRPTAHQDRDVQRLHCRAPASYSAG